MADVSRRALTPAAVVSAALLLQGCALPIAGTAQVLAAGFSMAGAAIDFYCDRVTEEAKQRLRDRRTDGNRILRCGEPSPDTGASADRPGPKP